MENLSNKSLEELKEIREQYIAKYIGDWNKPLNYHLELRNLDRLIRKKS